MKIGIISDTHDQVGLIRKAVETLRQEAIERLYHLGDWCSPFVLGLFADLPCEIVSIFGNNDADIYKLLKVRPQNVTFKDRFFVDEVDGLRVALIHGDPESLATDLFESGKYDLVLKGHNHVAEIKWQKKTMLINPGSLVGPFGSFTQWTKPSVAVYDTDQREARLIRIEK